MEVLIYKTIIHLFMFMFFSVPKYFHYQNIALPALYNFCLSDIEIGKGYIRVNFPRNI